MENTYVYRIMPMDSFVYIHGFNSGAESRSGRLLEQLLQQPIIRPQCDYSLPFVQCLSDIRRQILEKIDPKIDRICLMGSSLGGFFALNLRHPAICHVVAWNPVIYPAVQLERFIGKNTRFTDGIAWDFSHEILLSYAAAPDPRPWHNTIWQEECRIAVDSAGDVEKACGMTPVQCDASKIPARDIFLGTHDELLNSQLARAYWNGVARLYDIDSGHSIVDYWHAAWLLKSDMVFEM